MKDNKVAISNCGDNIIIKNLSKTKKSYNSLIQFK